MKRLNLLVIFFAIAFIFLSCTKNENTGMEENAVGKNMEAVKNEDNEEKDKVISSGFIYVNKAGLYTETDDGKMKWTAEASLGDEARYLGEKKEAVRTDGQKRNFFHAVLNGKKYWIQDYCYEPKTVPAFINAQDVVLYKSESLTAASDEILPIRLPVAVYEEYFTNKDSKFVKIAAYSSELYTSWTVKEMFVKREFVEMNASEVEAMYLALVASESRNDTIRAELFQNAIEMDSSYSEDIAFLQQLTETVIKEEAFMKTLSPEKITEKITVEEDVNLLSIPSSGDGETRILYTMKPGSSASATRKVILTDQNSGNEEEWLYIINKQNKGWVKASWVKKQ